MMEKGVLARQSRRSVRVRQPMLKGSESREVEQKEASGAVGDLPLQNYAGTRGRHSPVVCTSTSAARSASFGGIFKVGHSSTVSLFAFSVHFVCLFLFGEGYPVAASSDDYVTRQLSPTEEYLRGRRMPGVGGDCVRCARIGSPTAPQQDRKEEFMPITSRHEAAVHLQSGEQGDPVLGRVSRHVLVQTKSGSFPASTNASALHSKTEEHNGFSRLNTSGRAASAQGKEHLSAFPQGDPNAASFAALSAVGNSARGETVPPTYLQHINSIKQRPQESFLGNRLRAREPAFASIALYSASSAGTREASSEQAPMRHEGASLLSASRGAAHTKEGLSQLHSSVDEGLDTFSDTAMAYTQPLPSPAAVHTSSVKQTVRPHSEMLSFTDVGASAGEAAHARAAGPGNVSYGVGPLKGEQNSFAVDLQAPQLSAVSPVAVQSQSVSADQQHAQSVQQAGQPTYGASTSTQTSTAQLPPVPSILIPQGQRYLTSEPVQGAGESRTQLTGTPLPLDIQHQMGPYTTPPSAAGMQSAGIGNIVGAAGEPPLAGPPEMPPPDQQLLAAVTAVTPTVPPPSAGTPPLALGPAAEPSVGQPQYYGSSTVGTSISTTPAIAPLTLPGPAVPPTTSAELPATAPVVALPAAAPVTLPEQTVALPPLSLAPYAPAEVTGTATEGTAAYGAPAPAAPGEAVLRMAIAAPHTGDALAVSQTGNEGKERTWLSGTALGALEPSAAPASEEKPNGAYIMKAAHTQPTCLETCDCIGLILGGVVSLVVCLLSVLIATLLMSRLFSKGFFSVAFFKGGANAIIVAAALGFAIGGLTGGLVRHCWPGALYFGGGLMSFFAALVLLGKRGAAVGALGGVITGGCVGGLINTEVLPISLGCTVGLLLGIVLGFAPIFRELKMNTRYIRYGFESRQPLLQHGDSAASESRAEGSFSKRLPQRLFSSPRKSSTLRSTASLVEGSVGRRAESLPSSS